MAREAEGQRNNRDATNQYHNERWNWDVTPHTHMALEHTFTALGIAYYTMLCQGVECSFAPTLQRCFYCGPDDLQTWKFNADLPLEVFDEWGTEMIKHRSVELP